MIGRYRRDGTAYPEGEEGFRQWLSDFESQGRRVAETTLPDGKWVSTVWLSIDHGFGDGPPLIFETMVFPSKDDLSELDCRRYPTEAEALEGHEETVRKWSRTKQEKGDG